MTKILDPPRVEAVKARVDAVQLGPIGWTVLPLRDNLSRLWWFPLLLSSLSISAALLLESFAVGLATAAALVMASLQLWFPTRYETTTDGLQATTLVGRRHYAWSQVRLCEWAPQSVTLYVRPTQGRLRPLPMVAVRVPLPADSAVVRQFVSRKLARLDAHEESSASDDTGR